MHPFFDRITQLYPLWLAPNLMTFMGLVLTIVHFCLLSYYNPDFKRPTDVPAWAWFITGILILAAYALDYTDGKQARRTNTSSHLGELLDHGCDSWICFFLPCSLFSLVGDSASAYRLFAVLLICLVTFSMAHCETAITRIFYLPWSYDISQWMLASCCFLAAFYSPSIFAKPLVFRLSSISVMEIIVYASFIFFQLPYSLCNVLLTADSTTPWHRGLGCSGVLRIFVPFIVLFSISILWAVLSPTDVLIHHPRAFFYCLGTVSSNMLCNLIVSHMCQLKPPIFYWSLSIYSGVITWLLFVGLPFGISESFFLWVLIVTCTILHVGQGAHIVTTFARILKVNVFTIPHFTSESR